jgi:gamma-glutamylcyclotransferase (GGCT)/AIG2-like uncharacterized protein YtfP
MKRKHLFLTYGTLKRGYGNWRHYIACDPEHVYLGEFQTPPNYTLFDGGFPVVERGGHTSIQGELFEVADPHSIDGIFNLEGCHSQVQGDPTNWYDFDQVETPYGPATMFVMNSGESHRNKILPSGKWI